MQKIAKILLNYCFLRRLINLLLHELAIYVTDKMRTLTLNEQKGKLTER